MEGGGGGGRKEEGGGGSGNGGDKYSSIRLGSEIGFIFGALK